MLCDFCIHSSINPKNYQQIICKKTNKILEDPSKQIKKNIKKCKFFEPVIRGE